MRDISAHTQDASESSILVEVGVVELLFSDDTNVCSIAQRLSHTRNLNEERTAVSDVLLSF